MASDVIAPLVWDGSTLSIPRASSIQDGYLSKDTFLLFSGGEVVPVTSFNTRTGEVVLLEDDVLAALGYTPLDKHGDTMTGALTLAGPPSLPLHAATRAYVDNLVAPPATWYVKDFNASGSKLTFTSTLSAGATTVTLTGHDFAVGQGILIKGAGSSTSSIPGALLTKVDAVTGNVITLHAGPTSAVSAVANNVMHDDSDAINAALQAVVDAKGGTLVFAPGTYNVNGPILSSHNSIIRLPYNAPANQQLAVSLVGQPNPWGGYRRGGPGTVPQYGVVIQTEVRNAVASIFAGTLFDPNFGGGSDWATWFNHITLYMDGFTFRTYLDPQISALDCGGIDNICLRNIFIDPGSANFENPPGPPTHSGVFGIRTPAQSSGLANDYIENICILGYYIGCWFGEELRANLVQVFSCLIGLQALPSQYGARFYSALIWHCPTGVFIAGGGSMLPRMALDMSVDFESEGNSARWDYTAPGSDFYDQINKATGSIRYIKNIAGAATPVDAGITGFTKCDFVNLQTGVHRFAS